MTYDPSNRKHVREKEKEASLAERNFIAYTRQIMSEAPGRQWMQSLLDKCYIFGEPFVKGSSDSTAHNLGRQSVGKELFFTVVTHCPTEYIQMMQEASIKEVLEEVRTKPAEETSQMEEQDGDPV